MAGELSEMLKMVTVNDAKQDVVGFEAWRPRRPVSFQELESNMFLVKIDHVVDLRRVLEDGPWSFERNLVVLKLLDDEEQPIEAQMTKFRFGYGSRRIARPKAVEPGGGFNGDDMKGKNKKEILGFLPEGLQHIETVSEVSQRNSNFERLKTDYSRNRNMGPATDKTVNGSTQDEHNGANMAKKNTDVKMAKYESGPTVATQIETQVNNPITSQLKTWKRHNRGETENKHIVGTTDEIHRGKRSHDACVDGDTMDVDSAKRPKDHNDTKDFRPTIIFLMETRVCDGEGRPAKTPLKVLCLLLLGASSCLEKPSKSKETLHELRASLNILGGRDEANVKKRRDMFLANQEWLELYPVASFQNLARVASDHSPIIYTWASCLANGLEHDLCAILKECAIKLSKWNKVSFGHVQRSIKSKNRNLERSRVQWLREGDKNTLFFHSRASNQRKHNNILRVKGEDALWRRIKFVLEGELSLFCSRRRISFSFEGELVPVCRREYGRMILESVKHGLLIWPTIKENGMNRTKKYEKLFATEKIQADCDLKATNIILQGLPSDGYSLFNHHRVAKDIWERV
nr:reverse transcriptase [Tanacetum cinerariifolium]